MDMRSTGGPDPQLDSLHAAFTALLVAVDRSVPERIESTLRADPQLEIRTATSIGSMLEQLDSADCLVLVAPGLVAAGDPPAPDETESPDTAESSPSSDAEPAQPSTAETLDRIQRHVPAHPIVVLTVSADRDDGPEPAFASTGCTQRWTVHVPVASSTDLERVGRRIRHLVERHRLEGLSRRALAGIELVQEPIAIADPDGTLEFVNRPYAMQFGYDRTTLQGQPWRTCFSDETVTQLESTAIPTVADGWRWTGHCTGRRRAGDRFPVHVRLDGLEDGSLVFVVTELESPDGVDVAVDADADADADTDADADISKCDRESKASTAESSR